MAFRTLLLVATGLLVTGPDPLRAQVSLGELPEIARARAERQRPVQEKALEPFWPDLTLDYRTNREFLDERIAKVAELGDSVVPLLLEKLTPADGNPSSRNLAVNCALVLRRLDPSSFMDALLELAGSENPVARGEAIELLGYTRSPQAAQALADLLPRLSKSDQLNAIEALGRLRSPAGAATIANMLGSSDTKVREAALRYLVKAKPPEVVRTVLQALKGETDNRLLPSYVAYLGSVAKRDAQVTNALLPLLDGQRLDWEDTRRLVEVLATVAPEEHPPTVETLLAILDRGETGSLGLQAALTLQALGERSGMAKLHDTLSDLLRKPSHRKDARLYAQRADLYFASRQWSQALEDYKDAHENTSNSILANRCLLMMARCWAHRGRWSMVLRYLTEAQASYETVIRMSQEDPAMQEALQQEKIRSWLNELPRERSGG